MLARLYLFFKAFSAVAAAIVNILRRQGRRHHSYNALHAGDLMAYNSDMIAGMLADEPTITAKTANGVLFEWLGKKGRTEKTLQGRMQGFAEDNASFNWSSLGTF